MKRAHGDASMTRILTSPPAWGRGLKHNYVLVLDGPQGRPLRGGVD